MLFNKHGVMKATGLLIILFLLLLAAAGCNPQTQNPPTPEEQENPSGQGANAQEINLPVYYVKTVDNDDYLVREVHRVPYTNEVAQAALNELISVAPTTDGAGRVLPAQTKVLQVSIQDGVATVDFSKEVLRANVGASYEELGIQSIVNTLTEIPGIEKVSFLVEGQLEPEAMNWWGHVGLYTQPFTRDEARVYEPVIWVTSPVAEQIVSSPVEIRGNARVFEGTVCARLLDEAGVELASGFTTAAEGAPGRGEFALPLEFTADAPGEGKIEVFWESPKDGEELDKVVVPVAW